MTSFFGLAFFSGVGKRDYWYRESKVLQTDYLQSSPHTSMSDDPNNQLQTLEDMLNLTPNLPRRCTLTPYCRSLFKYKAQLSYLFLP